MITSWNDNDLDILDIHAGFLKLNIQKNVKFLISILYGLQVEMIMI